MQSKRIRSWLIGIVISAALVILLVSQLTVNDIVSVFSHIDGAALVLADLMLLLANGVRAVRFQVLMARPLPLLKILAHTTTYNLTTALVPSGLGEFYLPYAFEREFQLPISQGLSILLLTRLADLVAVVVLLLIGSISLSNDAAWSVPFIFMAIMLLTILLLTLTMLDRVLRLISRVGQRGAVLTSISAFLTNLSIAFAQGRTRSRFNLTVTTLVQWLLVWVSQHLLLKALGLALTAGQTAFGMGIVYSLAILPLSGIGNLGIRNVAWMLVLALLLALPEKEAIAAALAIHVLTLLCILSIWLVGQLIVKMVRLPAAPVQDDDRSV